ncbi:hypothetical protein E4H12_06290 [Candidatus Thorarchaeota archaeon]|nr:MAG: hypothetical protein E4H12_06290 [Candidatus Thorarchaeota archaeon]
MKKLLSPLLAAFVLSSCAAFVPKYDPVEYAHVVISVQMARKAQTTCDGSPHNIRAWADILEDRAEILEIYATYRPAQKEFKEALTIIKNNLKEFKAAYTETSSSSPTYCRGKLKIVELSLTKILRVMGDLQQ